MTENFETSVIICCIDIGFIYWYDYLVDHTNIYHKMRWSVELYCFAIQMKAEPPCAYNIWSFINQMKNLIKHMIPTEVFELDDSSIMILQSRECLI